MGSNVSIKERADFLEGLVARRFPFRRPWPILAVRMLGWGMSAAAVLAVLDKRYVRADTTR